MAIFKDKVAIVTGGNSGIGMAIVEAFASKGAQVVIAARRAAEANAVVERIGPAVSFVRTDMTRQEEVSALIRSTINKFSRLDCLVNNAGTPGVMNGIAETETAHWDSIFAVHVRGAMLGMKHAVPEMAAQGGGTIINVASASGQRVGFSAHGYSAAKAALIHLTRSVAAEVAAYGVRVNSISPGPILTGIFAKAAGLGDGMADRTADTMRSVFEQLLPRVQPTPRPGLPEDVARVALFLASDLSDFVTGQDIAVDGGLTTGRPYAVGVADRAELARVLGVA